MLNIAPLGRVHVSLHVLLGRKQVLNSPSQVYIALSTLLVEVGVAGNASSDIILKCTEVTEWDQHDSQLYFPMTEIKKLT